MKTQKFNPGFIRMVARENGIKSFISDTWIKSAHKYARDSKNSDDYYYRLKEFFTV